MCSWISGALLEVKRTITLYDALWGGTPLTLCRGDANDKYVEQVRNLKNTTTNRNGRADFNISLWGGKHGTHFS